MTPFWQYWIKATCCSLGLLGLILAGGAIDATAGPARLYFQMIGSAAQLDLNPHMRVTLGVLGGVCIGWSITFFATFQAAHALQGEAAAKVAAFNPDKIVLLPLYPQYSAATSGSSIKEWKDVCKKNQYKVKTSTICCYPTDQNFVKAHTKEILKKIKDLKNFKLIFSAHGLPEKNIKKGDPYQWQVEQSVKKIVEELNIENLDWILSYQSRVGPLKWIGPSTEDIIIKNSKIGKHIVLVPIAFVSEHSETLVELDIEYKELADANGCKNYTRVPALGTNEDFIKTMSDLIIKKNEYEFNDGLYPPKIQCPLEFKKCPCLNHE